MASNDPIEGLSAEGKDAILGAFADNQCYDAGVMEGYLNYLQDEMGRTAATLDGSASPRSAEEIVDLFDKLKSTVKELKAEIYPPPGKSPSLDFVVRAMLVTACRSPEVSGGDNFDPVWSLDESIDAYINRVYPKTPMPALDSGFERISATRFTASSLSSIARIKIEWTDRLTDHLNLFIGNDWKTLYLFRHPRYLKMCLEALAPHMLPGVSMLSEESLKFGCLPPGLLQETLDSYELFFPLNDRSSRRTLKAHVADRSKRLDAGLLDPFSVSTELRPMNTQRDAASLTNLRSLYRSFPHWGERLYRIWNELENPTPVTRWEKWSDKRKSAWYSTWWGVLGIILALFFGLASILLGALQVWISYCSWIDDPSVGGCEVKAHVLAKINKQP